MRMGLIIYHLSNTHEANEMDEEIDTQRQSEYDTPSAYQYIGEHKLKQTANRIDT